MTHTRDYITRYIPIQFSTRSNIKVDLHNRSEIQLYQQIFVKDLFNIEKLIKTIPKDNPIVFDIGANCGFFSLRIIDKYPKAKIFAFEPQERLVKKFSDCINDNNLSGNIYLIKTALGKEEGTAIFYENRSPISASLLKEKVSRRTIRKKYKITLTTLDQFCFENQISSIDILKVDVEGSELDLLNGATKALHFVQVLYIEVHLPFSSAVAVENILEKYDLFRNKELERVQAEEHDLVFTKKIVQKIS